MTHRLLIAAVLATVGLGLASPPASAGTDLRASGKWACVWAGSEGLCISNPGLPTLPSLP